jgi:hypothetical protein
MKLVELQRHLLALITGHAMACEDEEYVRLVQQSPHLITLHKIIALWRVYDLERACPLTVAFLKRQGMFDTQLQRFVQTSITSPFIEAIAMAFLDLLAHDSSLYLASLAQFERALLRVKQGDEQVFRIAWPCEPYALLAYALGKLAIFPPLTDGYWTLVARGIPDLFHAVADGGIAASEPMFCAAE